MMTLIDSASTQSRGRRPLPAGEENGVTIYTQGAHEGTNFGQLLSWVGGQAGLLWGMSPDVGELFGLTLEDVCQTHGSYGHVLEHNLSDVLEEIFAPHLRGKQVGVRFFQNGGDATAAAARLARAYTGRQTIGTQGYHGAALDFAHLPQIAGQEFALTRHDQFEFSDVERMRQVAQDAACLMVEVPSVEEQIARDFLQECRRAADENHIPLIIDDVVGGFRFALGGTCERYGVQADMICLGKAMSAIGGVSVLVGDYEIMQRLENDVFYSTTFGGNPGPLRVALESILWLEEHRTEVYGPDGHLQRIGTLLKDGLNSVGVPCVGQPERSALSFGDDATWLDFCRRMIENGIMMHRPNFVTLAHTLDDVALTVGTAEQVMKEMGL